MSAGPENLASSGYFKVYASLAAAESGLAAEIAAGRGPARAIRCENDGTLQVKGSAAGAALEPLPFKGGETQDVQAVAIEQDAPSTGCAPITVFW